MSDQRWYPALVIGGEATVEQRAKNLAFYQRIKAELHQFVFEVPTGSCAMSPRGDSISFRLKPDDECFNRLLRFIVDFCETGHEES